MKATVDSSIPNLSLDIKDVPLDRKINGPDVETLKGKSRSFDPKFPRQVNIPRVTPKDQILEMDLMYVDGDVYINADGFSHGQSCGQREKGRIQIFRQIDEDSEGPILAILLQRIQHHQDLMR